MIIEWGHFAFILALMLGIYQSVIPLWGARSENARWMRSANVTSHAQCLLVLISFLSLAFSFSTNDFSVRYVAANSNTHLPFIYQLCAIWGAHEGSMLLWIFILTLWMVLVSRFSKDLPLSMRARLLAVMSWIAVGFYLFILFTSNPFLRFFPNHPMEGADLNPILQDPGLAIHPPILYLGYVGTVVPFAFAIASLLSGRFDAAWARWTRPWVKASWAFLTWGIVLGSWWAYRELGWGGWWFWDPVENASFMPWLSATALMHVLVAAERRGVFKAWALMLSVTTFALSLLGTFLVRSGVLISVHSFASDPTRGLYMLLFLGAVVTISLGLYAWRAPKVTSQVRVKLLSRDALLLINNILLFISMLTVLLGTLYPLIMSALGLQKISVGAPYFNTVFLPLMVPFLFFMGIAPFISWHPDKLDALKRPIFIGLLISLIAVTLFFYCFPYTPSWKSVLGLFMASWIVVGSFIGRRQRWGMWVAHMGVAVSIIGITCVSQYSASRDIILVPGEKVVLAQAELTFQRVVPISGPNYTAERAYLSLAYRQERQVELTPELRYFPATHVQMSKAAIWVRPTQEWYVALARKLPGNSWSFRLYHKPFVRWIWFGGLLMMLGGLVSVFESLSRRSRWGRKECQSKN